MRAATHSLMPHSNFINPMEPSLNTENKGESMSSMLNGSSSDVVLQQNPLCQIIEKFSEARRSHVTGSCKPKLSHFIKTFEEAMVAQEQQYKANKLERQSVFGKSVHEEFPFQNCEPNLETLQE